MPNPFTVAGAPPALQAIIDARRARIPAGMTMTAGAPEDGGEQQSGEQQSGGENSQQQQSGQQQQQSGDDPVKVAETAAEESRVAAEKIRARLVLSEAEVAVWRRAQELGLNAAAINDSRSFGDAIAKLDPDADDFASKVIEAAQAAASKNPNLLASTGGKGGSRFSGGSGERRDASKAAPGTSRLEAAYGQSS